MTDSVTRDDALDCLYTTFGQDGLISREAFERAGEVAQFVPCRLDIEGTTWISWKGGKSKTKTATECEVCEPTEQLQTIRNSGYQTEHRDVFAYIGNNDVPFGDTAIAVPIDDTHRLKECSDCTGTGEIDCTDCGGEGEEPCRRCDGRGRKEERRSCQVCDGGELSDCPQCDGQGDVILVHECRWCNGSGTERCFRCHGDGYIDCETCAGEGHLHEYEIFERKFKVQWYIDGLPDFWGTDDRDSFGKTMAELDWDPDAFEFQRQNKTMTKASVDSVRVGVLDLRYEDEEYHAMCVADPERKCFIFDPETGPIETSYRRKFRDLRRRLPL